MNHLDFALVGRELPRDVHAGDCAARCGACNNQRHGTLRLELVCCMMHAVGCISQEVCCLRAGYRVLLLASEVTALLIGTSRRLRTDAKDGNGSRNARAACMQSHSAVACDGDGKAPTPASAVHSPNGVHLVGRCLRRRRTARWQPRSQVRSSICKVQSRTMKTCVGFQEYSCLREPICEYAGRLR